MLIIIRHGKVDLPYKSHDEMPFEILNDLATRKVDPISDKLFFESHAPYFRELMQSFNFQRIYNSPSARCSSLAGYVEDLFINKSISKKSCLDLQEIYFNPKELCSNNVEKFTLPKMSKFLFKSLVSGREGVEPLEKVINRIDSLMGKLSTSDNVLVLTHGYLMRVIVAHLHSRSLGRGISVKDLEASPRFSYFDGFIVSPNMSIEYTFAHSN